MKGNVHMSTIVYITQGEVADLEHTAATLFDGLLMAQEHLDRPVTWTVLTHNIAVGFIPDDSLLKRVAVFDLDTANGLEVLRVTQWVNEHTDEMPEVSY